MSEALQHRGADGCKEYVDGPLGLVHQRFWVTPEEIGEIQPIAASGSTTLMVMDGRLHNRDELVAELRIPESSTDAACALAAYGRWTDRFVEHLDGEFALVIVDSARRRLLAARDAIGIRPLYYTRTDRLFAFASEITALLTHPDIPTRPDDEGLADYLLASSRPLDRQDITCFAGISALPPSHIAIVEPTRVTTRRYWDFDVRSPLHLSSFDEYAEAFRDRFVRAVRRRMRSAYPVAVSVSGGLDSSSIYCAAKTIAREKPVASPRILGLSYLGEPGGDADEASFLDAVDREYGGIERFPSTCFAGFAEGTREQLVGAEAPLVDCMWGVTRELHRRAADAGARVLLTGHWGDQILCSTAYLVDLLGTLRWRQLRRHWQGFARWSPGEAKTAARRLPADVVRHLLPDSLLGAAKWLKRRIVGGERHRPWFGDVFLERALRHADKPARLGTGFHSAHARAMYLEARSKYHVHCMEWQNKVTARHGLDVSFPMLDRDLLSFLIAIPGAMQSHLGVPRAILREAMRPMLPEAIRQRSTKADFTGYINHNVAQDVLAIAAVLHSGSLGVNLGYFEAERLVAAVQNLAAGLSRHDCLDCWDLTDAYGLEIWLQVFLTGGQVAASPLQLEKVSWAKSVARQRA